MSKILTPVSFKTRRAPLLEKVKRDADIMYGNARYVIVLDDVGNVIEQRFNRRIDDEVVDCLAVFAPFTYRGTYLERTLVLEIGFRRFVPYAQTEHRLGAPTRRGPVLRFRKGEERKPRHKIKRRKKRAFTIKSRVPVAELTDDAFFDLMPTITAGIQECVDSIVLTWTNTSQNIRWVKAGNKARTIWMRHDMEHRISVRIPKKAEVLCATATFAEFKWRLEPEANIGASAGAIKTMLEYLLIPGRRKGRDARGNFSDDFVRESSPCHWVAERLKQKVEKDYSTAMVEELFNLMGPPGSMARKLVEQIWRVYKVPRPRKDNLLQEYQSKYREMKDLLLERWLLRNYRSLRLEKKRKVWIEERKSTRTYFPHASNSHAFTVFASKEVQDKMTEAYCVKYALETQTNDAQPTQAIPQISYIPPVEDDDIPWESGPVQKTGTDDEIPF